MTTPFSFIRRALPLIIAACAAFLAACVASTGPDSSGGSGGRSGDESAASTASGVSTSSSGTPATCEDGATRCADVETVETCKANAWTPSACADVCSAIGFTSAGCSADDCACGEPIDQECANGVGALCACAEGGGQPCSDDDFYSLYTDCYAAGESAQTTLCYGTYVQGDMVDCQGAADNCP